MLYARVFYNCTGLTHISIPSNVTFIWNMVFYGCTNLTDVTLPSGISYIYDDTFSNCTSLKRITIPSSVTGIGSNAFYNCTSLETVEIPSSVTLIDTSAFQSCTSIKRVAIPDSVARIEGKAFDGCSGLATVVIGSGLNYMGDNAFSLCSGLTGIYFQGNAPALGGSNVFWGDESLTVYYQPGTTIWESTFGGRPTSPLSTRIDNFRFANQLAPDGVQDLLTSAGDGVANIYKYAFNMIGNGLGQQPALEIPNNQRINLSSNAGLPLPQIHAEGGTRLQWTYIRRKASTSPGISYLVEFCDDLTTDSWGANPSAEETAMDLDGSDFERVTVVDSVTNANRRFSRIRITIP